MNMDKWVNEIHTTCGKVKFIKCNLLLTAMWPILTIIWAVYIIIKVMSPLNEYFIIEYDKRLCIYDNWSTL